MSEHRTERRGPAGLGRRLALLLAVAGIAVAGMVTTGPGAGASAGSCYSGTVCVFTYGPDGSARLAYATEGDLDIQFVGVSYWGGFVWNNGTYWPGADHIQVTAYFQDGTQWWTCLHYGPADWAYQRTAIDLPAFSTVTQLSWRGECAQWEAGWHQIYY